MDFKKIYASMEEYVPFYLRGTEKDEKWGDFIVHNRKKFKPCAVLLLVMPDENQKLSVLLTRRSPDLNVHGGQISLPGGRGEYEDLTPEKTALREAKEEIGLCQEDVKILGRLDGYFTTTGYYIIPVVGVVEKSMAFQPYTTEVSEIFHVPLSFLMDNKNIERHTAHQDHKKWRYFSIFYDPYYIWGATAGILVNFIHVLKK